MRVLWLGHFVPFPPTGHGALQRTHNLLKETAKRHEIHLLALAPPTASVASRASDGAVHALSSMAKSVEIFPLANDPRGVRRALYAVAASVQSRSFWESWYWSPAMFRRAHHATRTTHFDVVHLDTVFLARYLEAVSGTPAVLNHHNVESHLLRSRATSQRTPWGRAFFSGEARKVFALERATVRRVAGNIVVSPLDGERLREVGPAAPITTVPNGVDVDFFRTSGNVAADHGSMVFAGGMDWFPNGDAMECFASEIWPALLADNPNRTMTVIGRNPPHALLNAARDHRMRVLGFVDDVRPHIEAASIYVCPMRIGGGTRLKILDALAMSRPIVSTELGVEGLGLVEGEHYLAANDATQFVSQIRRLDADAELRRTLGDAGRSFVRERYSWHRIAQTLEQAYARASSGNATVSCSR